MATRTITVGLPPGVVTEDDLATGGSTFIPADIPSGSRLAVRVIDSLIVNNTGYSAVLIGVP